MGVLHYKDPATGAWIPIVTGPKGPKGDKGSPGGVEGPPGAPGATEHSKLTDLFLQNDDHPQYLKDSGDRVTGKLEFVDTTGEVTYLVGPDKKFAIRSALTGELIIARYTDATTQEKLITIDSSGNVLFATGHKVEIDGTLQQDGVATFAKTANFTLGADMKDQKVLNVLTPTAADDAANKAYVDGAGGIFNLSEDVASGAGNHWLNGAGTAVVWGGMTAGSDYLMSQKDGWYRCSFNGNFASNVNGSIRQMRLAINGSADATEIPSGAKHIGATATPNSWSGWGIALSASGIWHMPKGKVIRLMARHDAGVALTATGTITMQLVKPDA